MWQRIFSLIAKDFVGRPFFFEKIERRAALHFSGPTLCCDQSSRGFVFLDFHSVFSFVLQPRALLGVERSLIMAEVGTSESASTGDSISLRSRAPAVRAIPTDVQRYLDGYPGLDDDDSSDLNALFYQNKICSRPENTGGTIEEVLANGWNQFDLLESHHSYIQWLFPIRERGMNSRAQPLQLHEIATIRSDPVCLERFMQAYRMMLNFYGMELVSTSTGMLRRVVGEVVMRRSNKAVPLWVTRYHNLNTSSHNYLRITRIMKCCGEMGYEHLKLGFLLHTYRELRLGRLNRDVLQACSNYWRHTLRNPADVEALNGFLKWLLSARHEETVIRMHISGILQQRDELRSGVITCSPDSVASSSSNTDDVVTVPAVTPISAPISAPTSMSSTIASSSPPNMLVPISTPTVDPIISIQSTATSSPVGLHPSHPRQLVVGAVEPTVTTSHQQHDNSSPTQTCVLHQLSLSDSFSHDQ